MTAGEPRIDTRPRVVITGVTGYLGSQICRCFLQDGTYRVRGTVRSLTKQKTRALKEALGQRLFKQLQLVEADILKEETIAAATRS